MIHWKLGMFHWELGWFTKNSDWSRKHLRLQLRTAHTSCCFRTKTWYTHLNSMSWKAIDAWNNRSHGAMLHQWSSAIHSSSLVNGSLYQLMDWWIIKFINIYIIYIHQTWYDHNPSIHWPFNLKKIYSINTIHGSLTIYQHVYISLRL